MPTIAADSRDGRASTWVGAADTARDFVQIGTLENHDTLGGRAETSYDAFWTDTALNFHPHSLGVVHAGDTVTANMVQQADGWEVNISDVTHPLSRHLATHYGAGLPFNDAQWFQEDPTPHALHPVTDFAYPTMSTTTFTHLLLNGGSPVLPYADAHALISPNGVVLVPTRVTNDGFGVPAATGPQAQYLGAVAPVNAATNVVYSDLTIGPRSALAADTSALILAIGSADARLAAATWPPAAAAAVDSLIRANQKMGAEFRAWVATPAPSVHTFETVTGGQARIDAVRQIRQALGLPPA